ncbi:MAG: Phosphate propanoyltransferase [Firmicutes bacterium]|nr:Phosphate propanoyltransferase [candidate division NPL-UPA2 bacterium]
MQIPLGISNRHLHLSQEHLALLFGPHYELGAQKLLRQPGQYAALETVTLVGTKGQIEGVRVLGPTRASTQVEISRTDAVRLGIKPPVRESGNLKGATDVVIRGPAGEVVARESTILAWRHMHLHTAEAKELGLESGASVSVSVLGPRALTFHNVIVRVNQQFRAEFHIDTDEANACGLTNGDLVELSAVH